MLDMARPGDVIVVWRLDRLGRSLRHLVETVNQMSEASNSRASKRTSTPQHQRANSCSTLWGRWQNLNVTSFVSAPPPDWKQLVRVAERAGDPRLQKPSSRAVWHSRRNCTRPGKRVSLRSWSKPASRVAPRSINMS